MYQSDHTFHIPVMGTGFTLLTPSVVAPLGISSVVSLVDDKLVEQAREHLSNTSGKTYTPIEDSPDAREHRITSYLNLLGFLVEQKFQQLRSSSPDNGELAQYCEMLPETSSVKRLYEEGSFDEVRDLIVPGSIDVNIMTKLDCARKKGEKEYNDAMSALRGYARSDLGLGGYAPSSMVFSAGLNRTLYEYASEFEDFSLYQDGAPEKGIILKVSDYRSALAQGKFFAKKGLWVSEYRIESGVNCGGHAFPTKGHLIGPILDEFRENRNELIGTLHKFYNEAMQKKGLQERADPLNVRITFQGGITTNDERILVSDLYGMDSVGIGTPWLLVPDAISIDNDNLDRLICAQEEDIFMAASSPLGVPFWNLRNSVSEEARESRIGKGKPGAPCRKDYLAFNTDFTDTPICVASHKYQKLRLENLASEDLSDEQRAAIEQDVLAKSCICHDLGGSLTKDTGIDPKATPAVCPGPNIADFNREYSIQEMVDHIYGRINVVQDSPHMFIRELGIYLDYLESELDKNRIGLPNAHNEKYFQEFMDTLMEGIEYYRGEFLQHLPEEQKEGFVQELDHSQENLNGLKRFFESEVKS